MRTFGERAAVTTRTYVRYLTPGELALFTATLVGFLYAAVYSVPLVTADAGTVPVSAVVYATVALATFGGLTELWRINCERELAAR